MDEKEERPIWIATIQRILSDMFRQRHPRPDLTEREEDFIRNHVFNYINDGEVNRIFLYTSFHSNVEDEYSQHLVLQPNGTILEMPIGMGTAMSRRRIFWMVFNRRIYQIETNMMIDQYTIIIRRF